MWCLFFSFWCCPVWQTLGPSTSLQMTQFYGWIIFHCVYVAHVLYPLLCWWTFSLLPCPAIVNSAAMNIGEHMSLAIAFLSVSLPVIQWFSVLFTPQTSWGMWCVPSIHLSKFLSTSSMPGCEPKAAVMWSSSSPKGLCFSVGESPL